MAIEKKTNHEYPICDSAPCQKTSGKICLFTINSHMLKFSQKQCYADSIQQIIKPSGKQCHILLKNNANDAESLEDDREHLCLNKMPPAPLPLPISKEK